MNKTKFLTGRIEFVLCTALLGALSGCTTYVEQPRHREVFTPPPRAYVPPPVVHVQPPPVQVRPSAVQVEVSAGSVGVEIRAESDFYEPLTPYGRWEVVGSYGRCWIPGRVEADWRPYSDGHWQRTDAGWYWVSEEPWAWATYHYGRWDLSAQFGWYWVPQTQWAPAWVSWHSGSGYIGWAPLYPSARFVGGGSLEVDVRVIPPRAYVFVEQRRFLEPVRRSTVVVNNTTIINKTVNITNTRIVNNTVINEGPQTQVIEQVSGRRVQQVPVRELRRKQEAPVVARKQIPAPALEKKEESVQTPVRSEVEPRVKKAAAAPAPVQVEKPGATPPAPAPLTPTGRVAESEKPNPIPFQAGPTPETARPVAILEPIAPKPAKYDQPAEQPAGKSEKTAPGKSELGPRHEQHEQVASGPGGTNTLKKAQKKKASKKKEKAASEQGNNQKAGEQQTPPEKPALPPPAPL